MNMDEARSWLVGGSGFTQDWPIEQYVRDGRIARIYEGTNGIQAMDLVGRKLSLHKGRLVQSLFADMTDYLKQHPDCAHRDQLKAALATLEEAVNWLNTNARQDPEQAGAAATPFLRLTGLTVIAFMWVRMAEAARQAIASGEGNQAFNEAKQVSARFFFDKLLPEKDALLADIVDGKESLMALDDDQWAL